MLKKITAKFCAAYLIVTVCPALAAPKSIELPEETARLKQSSHPGYQVALQKCSICHSADYINLQPPAMNLKQWTAEVVKMQHTYGAPITNDEAQLIGEYLATNYGVENITLSQP